ncbi:unnamed protein product [Psylliodes chrysocephalus]|uniref:Uncharacterized protein n=1 Tax=Psylliodes chrysocephalus TaxID=3402493 RepID=A0A9P0DET1_9CUCU|nr:unnamed protein product [Psylliodes chrysocephala]
MLHISRSGNKGGHAKGKRCKRFYDGSAIGSIEPKNLMLVLFTIKQSFMHNLTIMDIQSLDGYCFIWYESHAEVQHICYYYLQLKKYFFTVMDVCDKIETQFFPIHF